MPPLKEDFSASPQFLDTLICIKTVTVILCSTYLSLKNSEYHKPSSFLILSTQHVHHAPITGDSSYTWTVCSEAALNMN